MARNKTLLSLLQRLRSELRQSPNPAHQSSMRDTHVQMLQRVQEDLWERHDWSHLRVRRRIALQAGQRYYDARGATLEDGSGGQDLAMDRVELVWVRYGEDWICLQYGIDAPHYAARDSDLDDRDWPVLRWRQYEDDQIEIWPVPADNADPTTLDGMLRLEGIRKLRPFVADDDRADLDDRLIVLYAAADLENDPQRAAKKLAAARDLERSLTANQSKVKSFKLFGAGRSPDGRPRRFPPRVHYRVNP